MIRYPRRGMYSAMKGDGSPFLLSGIIQQDQIHLQSQWDHVILDVWAPAHRPDIIQAFRATKPSIKLYGYCMGLVWWNNPNPLGPKEEDIAWLYYDIVNRTNGFLWGLDGRYWSSCNTNGSKWETMSAIADLYLSKIVNSGVWDGIFMDVLIPKLTGSADIDYQRLGYTTPEQFCSAWNDTMYKFVEKIRKGAPKNYPIMCNYGPGEWPDLTNGWMREAFPIQGVYDPHMNWQETMFGNYWGQRGYLGSDHEYIWNGERLFWLCSSPGYDQDHSKQQMRFGLGSATLGDGFHSFGRNEWEPRRFWWYGEYDLDLGDPLGWAYLSSNGTVTREFSKGAVVVNPQWSPKSVYLGNSSDRAFTLTTDGLPTGPRKTSFVVPARDSIFLLR